MIKSRRAMGEVVMKGPVSVDQVNYRIIYAVLVENRLLCFEMFVKN